MALADLLRAFERDAEVEVRAIAERAAAEASRVTAAAERERGDRIATATRAFADERRAASDAEVAAAARAARTEVLEARAAMLERIRAAVSAELARRVAGELRLAVALERSARAFASDETGEVRRGPTGGVLELAAGTRSDATLATLLDREWPQLACEALALERAR